MKKFKFKLEVVLQERKRQEDVKLRELMIAERLLQGLVDQKKDLEKKLVQAVRDGSGLAGVKENSSAEFQVLDGFISGTKIRIRWKTQEIERGTKLTNKKRQEYVAARQKREALEKLKTKRHQNYLEDVKAHEQRMLDDLYIMRASFLNREKRDAE